MKKTRNQTVPGLLLSGFYFLDVVLIARDKICPFALAVGADLGVLHRGVRLLTVLTERDGLQLLDLELCILQGLGALLAGPLPAVHEIFRNNAADLSDLERDAADLDEVIFLYKLFHAVKNIEYGSQFVHVVFSFLESFEGIVTHEAAFFNHMSYKNIPLQQQRDVFALQSRLLGNGVLHFLDGDGARLLRDVRQQRGDTLLAGHEALGSLRMVALEVDRVEHAARGAQAAADAAVRIDDRHAAAEAAGCLRLDLLLGEGETVVLEALGLLRVVQDRLTSRRVEAVGAQQDVVLVELVELTQVAADRQALSVIDEAVQGLGALAAGRDRVDRELRAGVDPKAGPEVVA